MNRQTRDILIVSLAAVAVVLALYFTFAGRSPKIDLDPYQALGAVTAEETAKLIGDQGQVLVIARDTGADRNPSIEAQLDAFERSLKKHPGLTQVTERFQAGPMAMMATGGGVPPDALTEALGRHEKAGALVLFCRMPPLSESELGILKQRGIKTVVVCSLHPEVERLLEQQVIHLAVVPLPEPLPPPARPPRSLRERFDQDYMVLSAAAGARRP